MAKLSIKNSGHWIADTFQGWSCSKMCKFRAEALCALRSAPSVASDSRSCPEVTETASLASQMWMSQSQRNTAGLISEKTEMLLLKKKTGEMPGETRRDCVGPKQTEVEEEPEYWFHPPSWEASTSMMRDVSVQSLFTAAGAGWFIQLPLFSNKILSSN